MAIEATETIRARYDRISRFYDFMEAAMERMAFTRWRQQVFHTVEGSRILEVGVGTGKNLVHYPLDKSMTAIDFSPRMLERAKKKAQRMQLPVDFALMDVECLEFPDHSFDTVVATFVFCSVPHPVQGLKEVRRVCKMDGKVILLEHMRPGNSILGKIFDAINGATVRLVGVNINRETMANIQCAGMSVVAEARLFADIFRLVIAKP